MWRLRIVRAAALAAFLMAAPSLVGAQDFGVAESAETIDAGTFKVRVNPMFLFGRDGQGDEVGAALRLGYGVTDRFDIEGGAAIYDDFTFFGADAEYWLVQDAAGNNAFDLSVIAGFHLGNGGDFNLDTRGFDLTFLASKRTSERLEIYGALDFAFESIREEGFDHSYTPVHLVPGLEYRVADDVDLLGEIGLGLNDEARHYVTLGLAFYFE